MKITKYKTQLSPAVMVKLYSFHERYRDASALVGDLLGFAESRGQELAICSRWQLHQANRAEMEALFCVKQNTLRSFYLVGDEIIELSVHWTPPLQVEGFARLSIPVSARVKIHFKSFCKDTKTVTLDGFKELVQLMKPFWAEFNIADITRSITFCGINEHFSNIPLLGYANYFGSDYCRFFGGVNKIESVGFSSIEPVETGALVVVGGENFCEFDKKRCEIQNKLNAAAFTPGARLVPEFQEYEHHVLRYAQQLGPVKVIIREHTSKAYEESESIWKRIGRTQARPLSHTDKA